MLNIKAFPFNPFAMNTHVLWDETHEGVIIDAGNYTNEENIILLDFIKANSIKIMSLWFTHNHIDHIIGAKFLCEEYSVIAKSHTKGKFLFEQAEDHASMLGFHFKGLPNKIVNIDDNEILKFGNTEAKAFYTPGHVDGSMSFYFHKAKFVIVGDVLFRAGIGRTDLPTGDYHSLEKSIREKLYTLPNSTIVFPGHGPQTSIGFEKEYNPYFQEL
ncbi:MAG: hypothetical protein AUJ98_05860 [Bacteroidetes bacterium CG2_30_33_31]|nr:MAG: hypothetical protein AUJ98_05860 [Bacteroidetes bacterium CG2_30_33_31]